MTLVSPSLRDAVIKGVKIYEKPFAAEIHFKEMELPVHIIEHDVKDVPGLASAERIGNIFRFNSKRDAYSAARYFQPVCEICYGEYLNQ